MFRRLLVATALTLLSVHFPHSWHELADSQEALDGFSAIPDASRRGAVSSLDPAKLAHPTLLPELH